MGHPARGRPKGLPGSARPLEEARTWDRGGHPFQRLACKGEGEGGTKLCELLRIFQYAFLSRSVRLLGIVWPRACRPPSGSRITAPERSGIWSARKGSSRYSRPRPEAVLAPSPVRGPTRDPGRPRPRSPWRGTSSARSEQNFLERNASDERGIDTVRTTIQQVRAQRPDRGLGLQASLPR